MNFMNPEKNWLDRFYYAAPVWLALETLFWPGFRAGAVTGGSFAGNLAFYAVEGGLGAALYFRLRYARPAALLENVALLVFYFKYILFTPLDIAAGIESEAAQAAARGYAAALPGAIYSGFHVVLRVRAEIGGKIS